MINERIENLKQQCRVEKHWDSEKEIWIGDHIDIDKFAMLLINESAKAIENEVNNWKQLAPFNNIIKQRGILAIKNQFGL